MFENDLGFEVHLVLVLMHIPWYVCDLLNLKVRKKKTVIRNLQIVDDDIGL